MLHVLALAVLFLEDLLLLVTLASELLLRTIKFCSLLLSLAYMFNLFMLQAVINKYLLMLLHLCDKLYGRPLQFFLTMMH